jgi:hypothetical protein
LFYLLKEEQGWVTFDSKSLGDSLLLGSVDLGKWDCWVLGSEFLGGGGVFWGKLLAVTTKIRKSCQMMFE